ncbi:MAG: hypothetical protein RQ753_04955 [Desulfurivibrionaceae bacterium]|nr:hypothetical protein [Desulfobulbales bacterium]MDT8335023.1 hypothetical protein [Desulfurivibrionaceae bacterium]
MRKSVKAALLSGLVFPGFGHFYLKRFITGALLLLTTLASLYLIITVVVERAMEIAARIVTGEVSPDVAVISEMLAKQAESPEARIANLASIVLLAVWLIGIFDSYRVGRNLRKSEEKDHRRPDTS